MEARPFPWEDEGETRMTPMSRVTFIHSKRVNKIADNRYMMGMVDRDVTMWEEDQEAWWEDGCPGRMFGITIPRREGW